MTTDILTTPTLPLSTGRWELDPGHSSVGFSVRHLGVSNLRGAFRSFAVDLEVGETLESTAVRATIDVASVDTGVKDRDHHLLAPDLLDVQKRPCLEFVSTGVEPGADGWLLRGDLTLGGVTAPVDLDVRFGGTEHFPLDDRLHAGFEAHGRIRRSDYGIDFGVADVIVSDIVTIDLDLQFTAPTA
jgi:polyisoprenoid-binding protein YceI